MSAYSVPVSEDLSSMVICVCPEKGRLLADSDPSILLQLLLDYYCLKVSTWIRL